MTTPEERYRQTLQYIYKRAKDGNWKNDRAIRRACIDALGEKEIRILDKEWEYEKANALLKKGSN